MVFFYFSTVIYWGILGISEKCLEKKQKFHNKI